MFDNITCNTNNSPFETRTIPLAILTQFPWRTSNNFPGEPQEVPLSKLLTIPMENFKKFPWQTSNNSPVESQTIPWRTSNNPLANEPQAIHLVNFKQFHWQTSNNSPGEPQIIPLMNFQQ